MVNVPGMNNVKAAVAVNEGFTRFAGLLAEYRQGLERHNLPIGEHPSSHRPGKGGGLNYYRTHRSYIACSTVLPARAVRYPARWLVFQPIQLEASKIPCN
jgi:hypothetical protein